MTITPLPGVTAERCCLSCGADITHKRRQAVYCDDACGDTYRAGSVYLTVEAKAFWKRLSRVSRNVRRGR